MQETQKYMIGVYMKAIYDAEPKGRLLEKAIEFENRLTAFAEDNPSSMDAVGDSGMRDEYNRLFMEVTGSACNTDKTGNLQQGENTVKLPTVHEFLDSYRFIYESSVEPYERRFAKEAYVKLLDVENRTKSLIEAQLIIERENLILNTITADYKDIAQDFLEGVDPNYEVISAAVQNTIAVYASAESIEEITYMGEAAQAKCDDLAVQAKLKAGMFTNLQALIFAWEYSKRRIRQGSPETAELAMSMVLTRKKLKEYCSFISEDMGIDLDTVFRTPFCRIMLLNPQGLDALWRIKKVMHPANLEAARYILEEEILTEKTIEEILSIPQKVPYYEMIDSKLYPGLDNEYMKLAEELNRDIRYFRENSRSKVPSSEELIDKTGNLGRLMAKGHEGRNSNAGLNITKDKAVSAVKETGKGILRGLFRR